ncbi:MAG: hypothetical protein OJJ21_17000 [Ferrovibrio sp.]|uniref:RNase H family protein n=1 Tax=Ferrovibrio sp. TaxID=1917215 RepID=UPI002621FE27|nr:RNase H family protein [Ferrovibrio sp.]MCW0235300.1 hypothetical protein [Ferrovibrio sp.]
MADASVDDIAGAAAWAAWVQPPAGRAFWQAGTLPVMSGNAAELHAIAHGLRALSDAGGLAGEIVVMSDSRTALGSILGALPASSTAVADLPPIDAAMAPAATQAGLQAVRELVRGTGARLVLRHVRGHQAGGGAGWLNASCDFLARSTMRRARDSQQRLAA